MKKILKMTAGLCALTCLSLTACSSEPEEIVVNERKTPESVYRMYYPTEVNTLNYLTTNTYNETYISANTIDCLVDYDCYGNVLAGLAESWSYNDDMTQWTFRIRQGVQWVDYQGNVYGEVTADDWVTAAEYVNNAKNESDCQYMYTSGSVVHGAQEYYDYTEYLMTVRDKKPDKNPATLPADEEGTSVTEEETTEEETVPEYKAEDIGVKAEDTYTLVYTLDQPCPFFLSVLSYPSFMPVNRQFLEEAGNMFGRDNKNLLYNGAYILSEFQTQEKQVMTKNPEYWDKDNVFIERIEREYNPEAYMVQGNLFLSGKVDYAELDTDLLQVWMSDEETKDLVHPDRPDISYSHFYTFNFDPHFDSTYEPENWKIAVNNENFRHALISGLDRIALLSLYDPYNPEHLINNTITPKEFTFAAGTDYTQYDALKDVSDSFSPEQAQTYRDAAREELERAGATFPIKVLMPYNPSVINWETECRAVETMLEETLGTDFIDIIPEAGPETGFLAGIRRSGKYAFMKCNWGADYADPQTYTEPFLTGHDYIFWDISTDRNTQNLYKEWSAKVQEASSVYGDDLKRYTLFAEAERLLIDHAIAAPFAIETDSYIASRINPFEAEYASIGIVMQRFKYCRLNTTSMSMEEYDRAYEQWQTNRRISLK